MMCKIAHNDRLRNEKEDKCYVITFDLVKSFRKKTSTPRVKVILQSYNATQTGNLQINTLLFFIELVLVITGFYGGELSRPRFARGFCAVLG